MARNGEWLLFECLWWMLERHSLSVCLLLRTQIESPVYHPTFSITNSWICMFSGLLRFSAIFLRSGLMRQNHAKSSRFDPRSFWFSFFVSVLRILVRFQSISTRLSTVNRFSILARNLLVAKEFHRAEFYFEKARNMDSEYTFMYYWTRYLVSLQLDYFVFTVSFLSHAVTIKTFQKAINEDLENEIESIERKAADLWVIVLLKFGHGISKPILRDDMYLQVLRVLFFLK